MLKNEDLFVEQAVRNVAGFCDRIIIADNGSTDGTWDILRQLDREYPHIETHRIRRPAESHDLIADLAGSDSWVFGVDGDEIYDPEGLERFRSTLMSGQYDNEWIIFSNVLNVVWLSDDRSSAQGYLAPPSRSITKLYNFSILERWDGPCPERLHGGNPVFKKNHSAKRLDLHAAIHWDQSDLRCLHLCFIPRSSRESRVSVRRNPAELMARGWRERLTDFFKGSHGQWTVSDWKRRKYMRGETVCKDVSAFFANCHGHMSSNTQ